MNSKIVCENEIENVTFRLSSNDDKKQYQKLFVRYAKMNDIIPIAPCDYFTTINAIMFSKTLEEVKERLSTTWAEYSINSYINFINGINGDD